MKKHLIFIFVVFLLTAKTLVAQTFSGGSGTELDPYLISSKADLDELADIVNNGEPRWSNGKYFKLTNDITEPFQNRIGYDCYNPSIPYSENDYVFHGNFDGCGYKIVLDINMPDENCVGLFGAIHLVATIKNVTVEGSVIGKTVVGGLIGGTIGYTEDYSGRTISCCYSHCDVTAIGYNYNEWINSFAGGLAGNCGHNVVNCYATGNVTSLGDGSYVGGLIGCQLGTRGAAILNCYATGNINSAGDTVGGLIGSNSLGLAVIIINCYFIGNINGNGDNVGGLIGTLYANTNYPTNSYYIDTWSASELPNNEYGISITADEMKSQNFIEMLNGEFVVGSGLQWDWFPDTSKIGHWKYDEDNVNQGFPITTCVNLISITDHSIATHFIISPNPTSTDAVISFGLLESGDITVEIYDLLGNVFYTVNNFYDAGEHFVSLDTKGIPSGSYICRMLSKGKQIGTTNFIIGR